MEKELRKLMCVSGGFSTHQEFELCCEFLRRCHATMSCGCEVDSFDVDFVRMWCERFLNLVNNN